MSKNLCSLQSQTIQSASSSDSISGYLKEDNYESNEDLTHEILSLKLEKEKIVFLNMIETQNIDKKIQC